MIEVKDKYRIYGNHVDGRKFGLGFTNKITYEGYIVEENGG